MEEKEQNKKGKIPNPFYEMKKKEIELLNQFKHFKNALRFIKMEEIKRCASKNSEVPSEDVFYLLDEIKTLEHDYGKACTLSIKVLGLLMGEGATSCYRRPGEDRCHTCDVCVARDVIDCMEEKSQ